MTTQPDQTYLARTFEDGRYDWTRTRRVRHRLVVAEAALLAALAAGAVVAATTDDGRPVPFLIAWSLGLFGFIPLHSMLNLGIRGLFDRSGRSLDEHQRRLREQSARAVQWPNAALTLGAFTGGVTLVGLTGHTVLGLALGFVAWFAAGLLAYWHLAWTLPDEDEPSELDA